MSQQDIDRISEWYPTPSEVHHDDPEVHPHIILEDELPEYLGVINSQVIRKYKYDW
jgi:hypothetical protein